MAFPVLIVCASLVVVDGDTVRCDDRLLRPMGDGAPFISGFDTPELFGPKDCPEELALARATRDRMAEFLQVEGLTVEDSGQVDMTQTHRPLVVLRLPDGSTVSQKMIEEGHARV